MPTYETRTHIDRDGKLLVYVPPGFADTDVRVIIEPAAPQSANGGPIHTPPPESAREHRRRLLDKVLGTIDDPTLVRPPQGEWANREPLD